MFLVVSLSALSQTESEEVTLALETFMTTENPEEGVRNLLSLKNKVENISDSLRGHYYLNLGIAYGQLNQADSSFLALNQAEKLAQKTNSNFLLAMVNNTRGLVYMGKAEYEASLEAYLKVMELAEGKNDSLLDDVLSKTYGNLGGVYFQLGNLDKALETTQKCLALSEKIKDTTDIALNHLRLAMVYTNLDDIERSISHLNTASTYFEGLNDAAMLVYAKNNLGKVYENQGDFTSAYIHFKEAYTYALTLGNQEELALTLLAMGRSKLANKEISSATNYAQQALEFSEQNGYANSAKSAYNLLYECALKANNIKQALDYRNAFIVLSDSLSGVEVKERVAALETQFETTKKEKEIQRLTFESQLKDANLSKARSTQIALGVGALAIILILIISFVAKQKKDKAERMAQALQVEALQKRFMELQSSPAELSVNLDMKELNKKLQTELSEREFEALKLCIEGKTNTDIAEQLFISVSTVKFHLRNAYSKLDVTNRKEAFQFILTSM
ncbi:MAG: tetratricopeptide repeat protein [Flavobacteriaceae bacterium]